MDCGIQQTTSGDSVVRNFHVWGLAPRHGKIFPEHFTSAPATSTTSRTKSSYMSNVWSITHTKPEVLDRVSSVLAKLRSATPALCSTYRMDFSKTMSNFNFFTSFSSRELPNVISGCGNHLSRQLERQN